ncbi:type 2 lantibiotic biosynthesis protein LanM [Anaerobacterium chartisolvens]|uniref:Type 2 lantibiotic biosynthesis protein LanM n=2 Tax=Anaerobacterium chartisolvens TaxID=1297424 RepID=A0A369BE13_9FIRM|nr:type 2 lantibiotic biosynthesis protein LanM [Anaerobacterium chartisolvens]
MMGEVLNLIKHDELVNYWKSFFPKSNEISDIEELIANVSGKRFEEFIYEYNVNDDSLLQSMIWSGITRQELLDSILGNLKNQNMWVYFYEPVLKKYIDKLFAAVDKSNIIEDKNIFLQQAIHNTLNLLHLAGFQTIIAEIYYARQDSILRGDSSIDRGNYYNEVLLKDNEYRKEIYRNYPELIRILDIKVKYSVEFIIKIINDTEKEINEIENRLNDGKSLGKIKTMSMGEGDTHNDGKSVSKLIFNTDKIIIYKPRNLAIEEKYREFLQWLNSTAVDDGYKLVAAKVYSIEDAGWMEFIEYHDCKSREELAGFYYKVGLLMCVLYTTNGIDIHHENIIAQGDTPVLVDLETFIHPDFSDEYELKSAPLLAMKELGNSVTKNILLPTYVTNKNNNKILDLGGLSGTKEQESPFATKFIENYGTDEVRVKIMHAAIEAKGNNPSIKGEVADSKCYREEIIDGFKNMYKWILRNINLYIDKIEELFSDVIVRIVYRPTNVYAQLLYSSYHPDLLTNNVDRKVFLHRIANKKDEKSYKMNLLEIHDMLQGDIPYFYVKGNGVKVKGIHSKDSGVKLKSSTIGTIKDKVTNMSQTDMYRQISIINSKLMIEPVKQETVTEFQKSGVRKWNESKFIRASEKIADYLLARSIAGKSDQGNDRTWFGSQESEIGYNIYKPMDNSIYYGLSGIAMFFSLLKQLSDSPQYRNIEKEVCETIIRQIPESIHEINTEDIDIGAFSGLAGAAYSLFYIDFNNKNNTYNQTIYNIMKIIENKIDVLKKFDIIREAGIIGVMLTIYTKSDNMLMKSKSLELAKRIYQRLEKEAIVIDGLPGITWSRKGYIGYAHGNAGVIAQIYRLYSITRQEKIKILVNKALLFERASYVEKEKNWKRSIDETNFSCGWCHGAPGILMSKLQLLKWGFRDEMIDKEIQIAISTTISSGLKRDWCLCHGDMGNLVILKEAGIVLNDESLYRQSVSTIEPFIEYLVGIMETEDFKQYENNGFMLGLAGIGYEILRIDREDNMPNIMALE